MKNSIYIYILACMTILLCHTACDQIDDQQIRDTIATGENELTVRRDCPACPGDEECCCIVWLQPTGTPVNPNTCISHYLI